MGVRISPAGTGPDTTRPTAAATSSNAPTGRWSTGRRSEPEVVAGQGRPQRPVAGYDDRPHSRVRRRRGSSAVTVSQAATASRSTPTNRAARD